MNTLKCAQICEQGDDLIIVLLNSSFDNMSSQSQSEAQRSLQKYASEQGLAGTVVPVWLVEKGMRFRAPPKHHPFFKGLNWEWVRDNLNETIFC